MGYLPYQLVQDFFHQNNTTFRRSLKNMYCISWLIRHTHLMKTLSRDAWSMSGIWVVSGHRKSKEWFYIIVVVWLVMIKPILIFFVLTWRSLVMRNDVFWICRFWISYIPLSELLAQCITSWLVGSQLWQLWSSVTRWARTSFKWS